MLVVGVTGGISAGKSTVSAMFTRLGARSIDADRIARQVVERDGQVFQDLTAAFGENILAKDGSLDRRELGRRAFGTKGGSVRLNEIIHPAILASIQSQLDHLRQEGFGGVVVVDAALLVECRALDMVDKLVVVEAAVDIRRVRLKDRTGLSDREISDRMAAQLSAEEKLRVADYIIANDGSLTALRDRVIQVWQSLQKDLARAGN